jgi:hypothetical protein
MSCLCLAAPRREAVLGMNAFITWNLALILLLLPYSSRAGENTDKKANNSVATEQRREIRILTLPKKPNSKDCFPQRFVRASASGSQIKLEDCKKANPDRVVAAADDRIVIAFNGKYGFCDSRGVVIVEPRFDYALSFSAGRAVVRIDGKYGYVNTDGHFAVKPQFDWAFSFYDGVGAVQQGRLWGLIDKDGAWKVKPSFKQIGPLVGGLYAVTTDDKKGFIDSNGNFLKEQPGLDQALVAPAPSSREADKQPSPSNGRQGK